MADEDDDLYQDLYATQPSSDTNTTTIDEFGLDPPANSQGQASAPTPSATPQPKSTNTGASAPPPSLNSFIPQSKSSIPSSSTPFIPQQTTAQTPAYAQQQHTSTTTTNLPSNPLQRPAHLPQPLGLGASNSSNSYQQGTSSTGAAAPAGTEDGSKMFVGGLSWDTTEDSLKQYFSQFGKVVECNIMKDPNTGTSRGFGFLKFEDPKAVNGVMVREHWLDGKVIDPKRAIPRDSSQKSSKIFVGGVPPITTSESFRRTFSQFGTILDHNLMMDKETGKPRGFGFVTFESEESGRRALELDGNVLLDGKMVDIRRATSKNAPGNDSNNTSSTATNTRRTNQASNTSDQASTPDFATMQAAMGGSSAFNPMMAAAAGGMDVNTMSSMFAQNGWGTGHWNPAMMQQMLMGAAAAAQHSQPAANGMAAQWNPMMMGGMGVGAMGMNSMMGGGYGSMAGMGMDNTWMGGGGAAAPMQGYGAGTSVGYGQQQAHRGAYAGMNRSGGMAGAHQGYQRANASRSTPTGPSSALPSQPRGMGLPVRPSLAPSSTSGGGGGGTTPSGPAGSDRGREASGSADPYRRERSPSRRSGAGAGGGGGGGYEDKALR